MRRLTPLKSLAWCAATCSARVPRAQFRAGATGAEPERAALGVHMFARTRRWTRSLGLVGWPRSMVPAAVAALAVAVTWPRQLRS